METFNKYYDLPLTVFHGMVHDNKKHHVMDIMSNVPDEIYRLISKIEGDDIEVTIPNKPVVYKPTKIYDAEGKHLISIRGWGRFKYLPNGAEIQDAIGREIGELINK